jgi:hypothetical protein
LDALGFDYNIQPATDKTRPLNKAEQRIFDNIKKSMTEIRAHQRGEIVLKDARDMLNEL